MKLVTMLKWIEGHNNTVIEKRQGVGGRFNGRILFSSGVESGVNPIELLSLSLSL